MGIAKYVLKRLAMSIPLLIVAICINFLIIHSAPGSPVDFILSSGELHLVSKEVLDAIKAEYGLDKPLYMQLFVYITKVLQGNLGYSGRYHQPVIDLVWERLGRTLLFMVPSFVISIVLGILTGIKSSENAYSLSDNVLTILSLLL